MCRTCLCYRLGDCNAVISTTRLISRSVGQIRQTTKDAPLLSIHRLRIYLLNCAMMILLTLLAPVVISSENHFSCLYRAHASRPTWSDISSRLCSTSLCSLRSLAKSLYLAKNHQFFQNPTETPAPPNRSLCSPNVPSITMQTPGVRTFSVPTNVGLFLSSSFLVS